MFRNKSWLVSAIFIALDILVIYGLFFFAATLRISLAAWLHLLPAARETISMVAQLDVFLVTGVFFLQGLYPGYGLTTIKELERMGKAITLAFILLASIAYINRAYLIFPRSIFPIAWVLTA